MLVIGARHPERGSTPPPALVKNGGEYGKEKVVGTDAQHLQAGVASPCIKNRRHSGRFAGRGVVGKGDIGPCADAIHTR